MSLKAKLEAVIYADEEPVTLAQLAVLFANDALEWKARKAEQDSLFAHQSAELETTPDAEAVVTENDLIPGEFGETGLAQSEPTVSAEPEEQVASAPSDSEVAESDPADAEAELRRAQRLREREVRDALRTVLDELIADYSQDSRGIEIREIAGGFRMGTKPEIHDAVRAFVKSLKPALKLSLPALETLAVIAYKQPVTAPEVGEIRGVDSAGVLGSLMSRKLIATAGRKQVIGRPMLYKTTKEFLLRFGLKDLQELPSMEEFEKLAAMELSEGDDEEASAPEQSGDLFDTPESNTQAPESVAQETEAVTPPAAEPTEAPAEAEQAPVERQDAEELEVSS